MHYALVKHLACALSRTQIIKTETSLHFYLCQRHLQIYCEYCHFVFNTVYKDTLSQKCLVVAFVFSKKRLLHISDEIKVIVKIVKAIAGLVD